MPGTAPTRKPAGQWAARVQYDPDKGCRAEDFTVPADEYIKRFQMRQAFKNAKGDTVQPTVDAVLQVPVLEGRSRRLQRWKPHVLRNASVPQVREFWETDTGKHKQFIEANGDLDFDGTGFTQFGNAASLIDTEFVPILAGPFYKQMYWYDYLQMHSRAFNLVNHNALAQSAVKILTRFVLGRGLSFHIKHPKAKAVWDEFWERNAMDERLGVMARDLTWQGELLIKYLEPRPGYLTVRSMDASTAWEIVTDPEDIEHVYYTHFQWPCLRGDVRIACLDGTNPTVVELAERKASRANPVWLYSYDHETGRVVPGKATKIWRTGRKRCVEVELDNGEKVVTSYDHPFLLRDGRYVQAEQLKTGDSLMPLYRRSGYEEVWHPGQGVWECTHRSVAHDQYGQRPNGAVTHHLNHDRKDNRPVNLVYVAKAVHDAETLRKRWEDPALAVQRERWIETMRVTMRKQWKRGAFDHLTGTGARASRKQWRKRIAQGTAASWVDPVKRERRLKPLREGLARSWADPIKRARRIDVIRESNKRRARNHKVVAVRPAGTHVVYDLQVEKYHNFALAAGVFTHNTPYQIWVSGTIPVSKYIIQQVPPTNLQHVKINVSSMEKRGRSELLAAMSWLKRFDDFYNGTTLKAVLEANLVWKVKVKGDQADVDAFMTNPDLTILPPPGGTWIENEAVELTAESAQMTASRGAMGIGQQIASIFATSMNLPSEYFNVEGTSAARATALVRTDPVVKAVEDRQQLFRRVLQEMYLRQMTVALMADRIPKEAAREEPDLQDQPFEANARRRLTSLGV